MRSGTEDLLKRELAALPELTPPPEAKARVLAAMQRAAMDPPRRRLTHLAAPALALAAAAAVAAVLVLWQPRGGPEGGPLPTAGEPPPLSFEDYAALVAQSAELERALIRLPAPRAVMRASTAGTIARLEDRIAQIDQELMFSTAAGVESGQQATLWQDRVEVMNALLQVRYANSQAFEY
jgi:hypothetical protein